MHRLIRDCPAEHIPTVLASDNRLINIGRIEEEALPATLKLSIDQVNGFDYVFAKLIVSPPALFGPIFSLITGQIGTDPKLDMVASVRENKNRGK